MIDVIFNGQAGNNLFQYFLGRCVALEKNYKISFTSISRESGSVKFIDDYLYFNGLKLPKIIEGKEVTDNVKIFENHSFDWNKTESEGKIILNGYFQNYSFYKKYKNFILQEIHNHNDVFNYPSKPSENDIVLHLRLKNYPWKTDLNFYKKILTEEKYDKIWLVTDEINHPHIQELCSQFNCKIFSSSPEEDFKFLINSNKIVMSQSTFCWWAAFISKAEKIFFPIVGDSNSEGIWFVNPWINIDLFVDDDKRFNKITI